MTSSDIISGFIDLVFIHRRQNMVFPNTFIGRWECDILELTKAGYLYEYEIKISKSDFRADEKKVSGNESKFESIKNGKRANYFYYLVPDGLILPVDVPLFAGLIYVDRISAGQRKANFAGRKESLKFTIIKRAPLLSKEKISNQSKIKLLESIYYRFHQYRKGKDKIKSKVIEYDNKI